MPTTTTVIILLASGLAVCGAGLLQTFLPLRAGLEAFSDWEIALLGAAYFAGFIGGCVVGPRIVGAVGHVRAFSGVIALVAVLVLSQSILLAPTLWIALRFLTGVCLAIAYMVLESWLNDEATNLTRGRVLSAYIIITNLGWILGQFAINTAPIETHVLFLVVAMLVCLSVVPVALTPTREPDPVPEVRFDLVALVRISPAGVLGCFLVGIAEGAFWSFGPVFGQEKGFSVGEITLLMAAFVLGGSLSQWPIGRWSDRSDRRLLIIATSLASVVTGLAIALTEGVPDWAVLVLALAHGAAMIPIYSLCLAHVNDVTPPERILQVSSGLLLVYSVGATLGAPAVAPVMAALGAGGLFWFLAAVLGTLAVLVGARFVLARRRARDDAEPYHPRARTTQSFYELELADPEAE